MNRQDIKEIKACLPVGKTPWHYFPKRYAPMLLSMVLPEPTPVAELRSSRYGKLLSTEPVREACAMAGDGLLTHERLNAVWPGDNHCFLLSLSQWGGDRRDWQQTSRPGYNLVLQINLAQSVERALLQVGGDERRLEFNDYWHPAMPRNARELYRMTLAWVRMDFDLDGDCALIEEIQSDWLRNAISELDSFRRHYAYLRSQGSKFSERRRSVGKLVHRLQRFIDEVVTPLNKIWSEAALAAAIEFLYSEIGFRDIYYHSFETGCALKRIRHSKPPRSVYTTLPERFCFEKTSEAPQFLLRSAYSRREIARLNNPQWYRLNLQPF